jgi:23S rRNA (uracil1939-C5)-methyltransferase
LNHILQLIVEKLVYGGDGLARLPADEQGRRKAVFIPFALPGETIDATLAEEKPGFSRARVAKILQASPQRIEPACPYFERCGGCHYQHAEYRYQLAIKAEILIENLRRITKLELEKELVVHPSPPWNYRNRSRLKVRSTPQFALGYFKFNSHELLAVEECPISSPLINRAIAELWRWGREGNAAAGLQEIEFFANANDSQLLLELHCAPGFSEDTAQRLAGEIRQRLPEIAGVVVFRQPAGVSRQPGVELERIAVSGAGESNYETEHATYRVSAGAFFQVNRHRVDTLVRLVTGDNSGSLALDLYAGGGLFSSMLARRFAQVIAVEPSQTSHADLIHNAPENVKVVRATTEKYLERSRNLRPDLVVVDPPRGGLGAAVVKALAGLRAARMTYVSCDPATLARDLSGLLSAGYRVERAELVDLFPQTYHLESVFHLVR